MEKVKAEQMAEEVVKKVVNMIAERRYGEITKIADMGTFTGELIRELVEDYLELNELPYIDHYDAGCNFHPGYEYKQLSIIYYSNGRGFHVDYDLTTQEELNDLTLQMEFLYNGREDLTARFLDLHVM